MGPPQLCQDEADFTGKTELFGLSDPSVFKALILPITVILPVQNCSSTAYSASVKPSELHCA